MFIAIFLRFPFTWYFFLCIFTPLNLTFFLRAPFLFTHVNFTIIYIRWGFYATPFTSLFTF